jgi:hypothetical protein
MYDNVMNKFKFGKFKTAKYLDHESTSMFYPVMVTTFLDLAQNLVQEGKNDKALKVVQKYDAELPDIYPYVDVAGRKLYLTQLAYQLHDVVLGNKLATNIDNYLTDQLDYNAYLLSQDVNSISGRDVQIGMQVLNGLVQFTKDNHQTALATKFENQLKGYETKFRAVLGGGQ